MNHTKAIPAAPAAYSTKNVSPCGDNTNKAIESMKLIKDTITGFLICFVLIIPQRYDNMWNLSNILDEMPK